MTKISKWAAVASATIGMMATACTVTTGDDGDGGTGGSTGGSAGSGGSAGTAGTAGTGGASGASMLDAAVEATVEAAAPNACERCVTASACSDEATACRTDTNGCADAIDDFYLCLAESSGDSVTDCSVAFASGAQHKGGNAAVIAADLANQLGRCAMDLPCITTCGGDAGR